MRTVFTATQIHNYSKKSYFQKFRLNIENPGKLFQFPGFQFPLKSSGIGNPNVHHYKMDCLTNHDARWNIITSQIMLQRHNIVRLVIPGATTTWKH